MNIHKFVKNRENLRENESWGNNVDVEMCGKSGTDGQQKCRKMRI